MISTNSSAWAVPFFGGLAACLVAKKSCELVVVVGGGVVAVVAVVVAVVVVAVVVVAVAVAVAEIVAIWTTTKAALAKKLREVKEPASDGYRDSVFASLIDGALPTLPIVSIADALAETHLKAID